MNMRKDFKSNVLLTAAATMALGFTAPAMAEVGFGKPGEAVNLVIGYQPYYTESWSGVVINGKNLWKKHQWEKKSIKY